jgi:hypothetical protein
MSHAESARPLSPSARRVLDEVAAQLEQYATAVRGLCAHGEVRHTKHGAFGPEQEPERIEERLDASEEATTQNDFLPLLTGTAYERVELPASSPNELSVRAVRREDAVSAGDEIAGADLMFTKEPARLVQALLHPPAFAGIAGLLIETVESATLFGYVNGVPLPVKISMRMWSRGIGRFRIDQETVIIVRYEPCA